MRVDFINFESKGPMMGACTNDSISITGIDDVSMKVLPSNLCGTLTGQHLYLSTKDSTSISITVKLAEIDAQRWQILLRFYEADQTALLAPRGCLQYFRNTVTTTTTKSITTIASCSTTILKRGLLYESFNEKFHKYTIKKKDRNETIQIG